MRKLGAILLVLLLAVCVCVRPIRTGADLGDFSGGSDYGGSSSWSSGSSWDSGSSWSSGSSYGSSSGNYYYYGGSSSSGDDTPGSAIIGLIVVIAIIFFIRRSKNGGSFGNAPRAAGAQRTSDASLRPMSEYMTLDPDFSEQRFKEKLSNIYVQMQNCCTDKDISPLRPYFTDSLYQQFERQINGLKQRHETNYVERIAVLDVRVRGFVQRDGQDHIIVELYTRITDYTLRDSDGKLVSGDQKAEKFMTYEYDLARPTGTRTAAESEATIRHCPNCGAPLSINESAKCPYCDMVITLKQHDWTINSIKGISQRTSR